MSCSPQKVQLGGDFILLYTRILYKPVSVISLCYFLFDEMPTLETKLTFNPGKKRKEENELKKTSCLILGCCVKMRVEQQILCVGETETSSYSSSSSSLDDKKVKEHHEDFDEDDNVSLDDDGDDDDVREE